MNWRERMSMGGLEGQEMAIENMAATRIMKGIGASYKDIGKLCSRFGIDYNENESSFDRAVKILRETYDNIKLVDFIDVKMGKSVESIYQDLLEGTSTGIVFYRIKDKPIMTALVRGIGLTCTALGKIVIRPGAKYLAEKDGMELWEQDPVILIKSFSSRQ